MYYHPFGFIEGSFSDRPYLPYDDIGDAWEVQIEVPGIKKEDIQISVKGDLINISAVRKLKSGEDKRVGSFGIPQNADMERAEAFVEDGILTVRLPKSKVASPRMIPIR